MTIQDGFNIGAGAILSALVFGAVAFGLLLTAGAIRSAVIIRRDRRERARLEAAYKRKIEEEELAFINRPRTELLPETAQRQDRMRRARGLEPLPGKAREPILDVNWNQWGR